MKFIKSKYKIILGLFLLASCTKDFRLVAPDDFQVTTEASTYRKGEPVKFSFTGNPQLISMYTGEVGKDYAYKDGRVMDVSSLKLSLNSSVTSGTGTGAQQSGMFSLMASTDFNGDYSNFSGIEAATWTDITSRLSKQEAATTTTINAATPPEGMDLTDLRVPGKPLYIAFKYNIREQSLYGIWRAWRFQAFTLSAITEAGTHVLGNMTTTSFRVVQKNPEIISRTTATTATLTLMHSDLVLYPQAADIQTQNWIITNAFNNVNEIDFGPDSTIPIQGGTSAVEKKDYSYTFTKAGNYKVYFIASNTSTSDRMDVVREVDITITD